MGIVSIDLDKMEDLVSTLKTALQDIPDHVGIIKSKIDYVQLFCSGLSRWTSTGDMIWQLDTLKDECQRRLDKAKEIAASDPTISRASVPVDEIQLGQDDAQQVIDLILQYEDGNVPQSLIDLLQSHEGDTEFGAALARNLDPSELALLMERLNNTYQHAGDPWGPLSGVSRYDFANRYASFLDLIGGYLSAGASVLSPDELQTMTQRWASVIEQAPSAGTPLSLVISRGMWPSEFLTGIKEAVDTVEEKFKSSFSDIIEPGHACDIWLRSGAPIMIDPGRRTPDGQPLEISDPMYGLLSAGALNPEWFITQYHGGDTVEVTYDGENGPITVSVDSRMADLFRQRGFADQASIWAFIQAASVADTWQIIQGVEPSVTTEFEAVFGSIQRDQTLHDALPWYQKYSHEILNAISLVTGVAAVFVPGPGWVARGLAAIALGSVAVDLGLSIYEGDYRSAIIDGVFLLPVAVGGVFKLIRVTQAELTALRTLEVGTVMHLADGSAIYIEEGRFSVMMAKTGAYVEGIPHVWTMDSGKWEYFFGRVTSGEHNTKRSVGLCQNLNRIGIYDDALGRARLTGYFDSVVKDDTIVIETQETDYGYRVIKQSNLYGPDGYLIVETTWDVSQDGSRLITMITKYPN